MKKLLLSLLVLLTAHYYLLATDIFAQSQNTFGLHLTQTSDILSAHEIINSSGGSWGWVTIVIRTDQLDYQTWQDFFNNCRRFHLIPILRLATTPQADIWPQPSPADIDNLANFLNSLNWPIQNQYIILFNEVNHGAEWGGGVNAKNYTDIALYAIGQFKELNPDFFILNSPLDNAAPDKPPNYQKTENFLKEIYLYRPEFFDQLDGWASHSYPNHGFIGTPGDTGLHSISGYRSEITLLHLLGVNKTLPVFITETGWPHFEGNQNDYQFYNLKTCTQYLTTAFDIWSQDPQIQAVTPFIYNYSQPPFDHFSWLDTDQNLYEEYQVLVNLPKTPNFPLQRNSYQINRIELPFIIFPNRHYTGYLHLQNTGQAIWGETSFCLQPRPSANINLDSLCLGSRYIPPGQIERLSFNFQVIDSPDPQFQSYLGWEYLPDYPIYPFTLHSIIYKPQSILSQIRQKFLSLFSISN